MTYLHFYRRDNLLRTHFNSLDNPASLYMYIR